MTAVLHSFHSIHTILNSIFERVFVHRTVSALSNSAYEESEKHLLQILSSLNNAEEMKALLFSYQYLN